MGWEAKASQALTQRRISWLSKSRPGARNPEAASQESVQAGRGCSPCRRNRPGVTFAFICAHQWSGHTSQIEKAQGLGQCANPERKRLTPACPQLCHRAPWSSLQNLSLFKKLPAGNRWHCLMSKPQRSLKATDLVTETHKGHTGAWPKVATDGVGTQEF